GHLRADPGHRDETEEQLALRLGGESVQVDAVVLQDQMGEQGAALPGARHLLERLRRDAHAVADALTVDHDVIRAARLDRARYGSDHVFGILAPRADASA